MVAGRGEDERQASLRLLAHVLHPLLLLFLLRRRRAVLLGLLPLLSVGARTRGVRPLHHREDVPDQMKQHGVLLGAPARDESDPQLVADLHLRVEPDDRRVVHHARLRELHEGPGHRRAEQHGLPALRHRRAYLTKLHGESHLEQPIGLVEHGHLALPKVEVGYLAQMMAEPAGRRHDDVGVAGEEGELLLHALASVDAAEVEAVVLNAVVSQCAEDA